MAFRHLTYFPVVVFIAAAILLAAPLSLSHAEDTTLAGQFPVLTQKAGWDEHDFATFVNAQADGILNVEGIKNLTIGAKLNTREATYMVNPVFDLGLLDKDNKLDKNLSSSTEAVTELQMTSRKNATEECQQHSEDVNASFQKGFFKVSAAEHYGYKSEQTASTGSIYIDMSYTTRGAYVSLTTGLFSGNADLSKYLLGTALDAAAIKSYVDYKESTVPGKSDKYISSLQINNNGQLKDMENVYGNLQLLTEMERIFGLLRSQYDNIGDAAVKETLKKNMTSLRMYISRAIRSFYAQHGDAFVSKIKLLNYAYGSGTLDFTNTSGTTEENWGASISASYQGEAAGGGGSATVTGARSNGWAEALKNAKVEAHSFPKDVIDVTSWATQIYNMLKDESQPITVPAAKTLQTPDMKLPDPVGPQKTKMDPPDSCFQSMDDWTKYWDMKKPQGEKQDQQQGQQEQKKVDENGAQKELNPEQKLQKIDRSLYDKYREELNKLTALKKRQNANRNVAALLGGNIIRVDKMFVSGFEMTPYDKVIPQLRPNLDIPGETSALDGYPNVSKLMYVANIIGDLDNYLRFQSNFTISGVSKQMSDNFKSFYDAFFNEAYDNLIVPQLNAGRDIPADLLASFSVKFLGNSGSESESVLYGKMGGLDAYRYITDHMLQPENVKIWRSAPGGYIPFGWNATDKTSRVSFFNPIAIGHPDKNFSQISTNEYKIYHDKLAYSEPQYNPLAFYDVFKLYTDAKYRSYKSPWYPVFQYNKASVPNLLFVQTLGPYQLVIGAKYAMLPSANYKDMSVTLPLNTMKTRFAAVSVPTDFTEALRDTDNNLKKMVNWDYCISFPNSTPEKGKFNTLTLVFEVDNSAKFEEVKNWYYLSNPLSVLDEYGKGWMADGAKNAVVMNTPNTVDLKNKYPNAKMVLQLLPINKETCGDNAENGFSYATNFNAGDLVGSDTYVSSYKMTLFND